MKSVLFEALSGYPEYERNKLGLCNSALLFDYPECEVEKIHHHASREPLFGQLNSSVSFGPTSLISTSQNKMATAIGLGIPKTLMSVVTA